MDDNARLQLQNMIKANNVEDQTQLIRDLKHSHILKSEINNMIMIKAKYRNDPEKINLECMNECGFLFTYYTDIYNNIIVTNNIEDNKDNIIIVPESYINFINVYNYKCKLLIWWLSYDYGIDKFNNLNHICKNNIIHLCQSFYAYIKLIKIINAIKIIPYLI